MGNTKDATESGRWTDEPILKELGTEELETLGKLMERLNKAQRTRLVIALVEYDMAIDMKEIPVKEDDFEDEPRSGVAS